MLLSCDHSPVDDVPHFAESLFSVPAADFIDERKRLARDLREEGRKEDAAVVVALRKPAPVVLAANRAARSRPKVARAAAAAAARMTKRVGDADVQRALDDQLALLEEVALAFLVGEGNVPSEATRRRLHDLLRNAIADEDAREALARGVLADEPELAGFAAYTGMPPKASPRASSAAKGTTSGRTSSTRRAGAGETKTRERARAALREAVDAAQERLNAAKEAEAAAVQERARAEKALAAAQRASSARSP